MIKTLHAQAKCENHPAGSGLAQWPGALIMRHRLICKDVTMIPETPCTIKEIA